VKVHLDRQGIFADHGEIRQPAGAIVGRNDGPRCWTWRVAFAVPGEAGIGVDPDQGPAVLELERMDFRNFGEALRPRRQCTEVS